LLKAKLVKCNIDFSVDALIVSECVLIYVDAERGDTLLHWFARTFSRSSILTYEQIHPDDPFGRQMVQNITRRGCALASLHKYPNVGAQKQRYIDAGWQYVVVRTMNDVYDNALEPTDKRRIERLELFDEIEEWRLIQHHYCIVLAKSSEDVIALLKL